MRLSYFLSVIAVLLGFLTSYCRGQGQAGGLLLCGGIAVGSLLAYDRIICEEEKDDERDERFEKLCVKRHFESETTCKRCIEHGKDKSECNADFGPNNMDDAVDAITNDDCVFDEDFDFCLDEHA